MPWFDQTVARYRLFTAINRNGKCLFTYLAVTCTVYIFCHWLTWTDPIQRKTTKKNKPIQGKITGTIHTFSEKIT
jgi:hypothetical protein